MTEETGRPPEDWQDFTKGMYQLVLHRLRAAGIIDGWKDGPDGYPCEYTARVDQTPLLMVVAGIWTDAGWIKMYEESVAGGRAGYEKGILPLGDAPPPPDPEDDVTPTDTED